MLMNMRGTFIDPEPAEEENGAELGLNEGGEGAHLQVVVQLINRQETVTQGF